MSNWRKVGDLIKFHTKGITPKYVDKSSIMVLNQKCIRNHHIDFSYAQYTDDTTSISENKFIQKGDILINSTGQGTAGRCAFVNEIPHGIKLIPDSHILLLRCSSYYEAQCLSYSLFSFEETIQTYLDGSTGQGELDRVRLFNLLTSLPSDFKIQQKIAAVLSALDSKIELNNCTNAELEVMAKTLYDYWFVQFDFPDPHGKPYKTSGGKMVFNAELNREIPDGWEVEKLHNVIDLILDHRGKTPLKLGGNWITEGEGIIAISAKNVKDGKLINLDKTNRVSWGMYEKWMPEKLKDGDILMTSEAPLGEFYFVLNFTDYCMSQRLFGIRPDRSKVLPTYLYFELSKGNGFSQIIGSQSGSTVFGIRQDELRKIKVLKPKLEIQVTFDKIVLPMFAKIRVLENQNQQLAELRDWLLPMLMNGQVVVKDEIADADASY